MRVWLVDNKTPDDPASLQGMLQRLAAGSHTELTLLGMSPYRPDFVPAMRSLLPDLIVVNDRAWPEALASADQLDLAAGWVIATCPEQVGRFAPLAEALPLTFIPHGLDASGLWLALVGTLHARHRHKEWKSQVAELQQRLTDRIVIERAKGVLVQHLTIGEEEAYKRLRVLSRRQRRPIRDIAQSLLDTQLLLSPEPNGLLEHPTHKDLPEPKEPLSRYS